MTTTKKNKAIPLDFSGLVLGFYSAALHYMGVDPDLPNSKGYASAKNPPLAQHNIAVLELLRIKTINNLTPEESNLLDSIIKDIHEKYRENVG